MGNLRRCTLGMVVSLVAAFAVAPAAGAADDYFLRIEGIPGESNAAGFVGTIPIDVRSFDWSAENPTTVGSASSGAGSPKARLNELTVDKSVDAASVPLFQRLAQSKPINSMELIVRRAGTTPFIFLRYCFQTVFVTSQKQSGSTGDVVETVNFAYRSVTQTYTPQTTTGTPTPFEFGWDQTTNAIADPFAIGTGPSACTLR
jgi:type VI secretion system secreted protein Hcp